MTVDRKTGHAPRVAAMARELGLVGACIGGEGCRGFCAALMEVMAVPGAVLGRGAS